MKTFNMICNGGDGGVLRRVRQRFAQDIRPGGRMSISNRVS
jgi:hypothetical protein